MYNKLLVIRGVFMTDDTLLDDDIKKLEKERESYITRLFWFMLEIALIFIVPAVLFIFLFRNFLPDISVWVGLGLAFVISWVIVVFRYLRLYKTLSSLDGEIKELKDKKVKKIK